MKKEIASKLLTVLDFKVVETLNLYIEERVSLLNKTLQQSKDMNTLMEAQGSVKELELLRKLRDNAFNIVNGGPDG